MVGKEFLSTPSARRATGSRGTAPRRPTYFYPRPPRGGRLGHGVHVHRLEKISIHALREEGDAGTPSRRLLCQISIHALREEGDGVFNVLGHYFRHISIHALREEGDRQRAIELEKVKIISIHALREEGDVGMSLPVRHRPISIHALREEGDEGGTQ